jgi:2-dehydro-3-deoxy-D-gluconate 5-dehydrogenase
MSRPRDTVSRRVVFTYYANGAPSLPVEGETCSRIEVNVDLFNLSGKVAIVTGGNGGLGLGMARGFAAAGARVAVVGRSVEKTERAVEEIGPAAIGIVADVSVEKNVDRIVRETVSRFGQVDILVNNAGITVRKRPEDYTLDDWRSVMDVNVTSAFLMAKAVYPSLKSRGGGKVINIGSLASIYGASYAIAYSASKGAIVQLTKSLALAWAADNVHVNAILPGWFETEMTDGAKRYVPGLTERVVSRTPLGRWAKPEDIVGTAIWLASAASDFVTGIAVPVDGGYTAAI